MLLFKKRFFMTLEVLVIAILSLLILKLVWMISLNADFIRSGSPKPVSKEELPVIESCDEGDDVRYYIFPCHFSLCNSDEQDRWRREIYEGVWDPSEWFDDPAIVSFCNALLSRDTENAEKILKETSFDINARGNEGMTILFWSIFCGYDQIEFLLRNGASPDFLVTSPCHLILSSPGEHYPLLNDNCFLGFLTTLSYHESEDSSHRLRELVKLMLKYGADANYCRNEYDIIWYSPSYSTNDQFSLIRLLIASGFDVQKASPLYWYVTWSSEDLETKDPYVMKNGFYCDLNVETGRKLQSQVCDALEHGGLSPIRKELNEAQERNPRPDPWEKKVEKYLQRSLIESATRAERYRQILLRQGVSCDKPIPLESGDES